MHPTQLSLATPVKNKRPNVPVFLIYAGIIHAIGLALLLPIVVTLPGPGGEVAPELSVIDIQIVPAAPLAAKTESDSEQTSALPAEPEAVVEVPAVTPDQAAEPAVNPDPETPEPEGAGEETAPPQEQPEEKASPRDEPEQAAVAPEKPQKAKSDAVVKPAPKAAKKLTAVRSKVARPAVRRSAKKQTKIAPFNGALSGLFTPGAPARRR